MDRHPWFVLSTAVTLLCCAPREASSRSERGTVARAPTANASRELAPLSRSSSRAIQDDHLCLPAAD
jgi:hypothetical protein